LNYYARDHWHEERKHVATSGIARIPLLVRRPIAGDDISLAPSTGGGVINYFADKRMDKKIARRINEHYQYSEPDCRVG
jgi:hypothetical protein